MDTLPDPEGAQGMGASNKVGNPGATIASPPSGTNASRHVGERWAQEICSAWANGTSHTLVLARITCQAKQTMPYGAWAQMWRSGQMPFSKRKADMLVCIGRNAGGIDEQTFARL